MSSKYQPKNKNLSTIEVVSSDYFSNNIKQYNLIGVVRRGLSSFITTTKNKKTKKIKFKDDTSSLTKKTKNDLVSFFSDDENASKNVAYLVVKKDLKKKGNKNVRSKK